jgi:hypothetical protein
MVSVMTIVLARKQWKVTFALPNVKVEQPFLINSIRAGSFLPLPSRIQMLLATDSCP